jgi:hypothetical protein
MALGKKGLEYRWAAGVLGEGKADVVLARKDADA